MVTVVSSPSGTACATSDMTLVRRTPPGPLSTTANPGSPSESRHAVNSESTLPSKRTTAVSMSEPSESTSKLKVSAPRSVSRSPPGVVHGSSLLASFHVASSASKLRDNVQAESSTESLGSSDRAVSTDSRIAAAVKLSIASLRVSTNTESGIVLKRPRGLARSSSRSERRLNDAELGTTKPQ